MAKIAEQTIVIKIQKLVKESEKAALNTVDAATKDSLVEIVEQLINDPAIVVELGNE